MATPGKTKEKDPAKEQWFQQFVRDAIDKELGKLVGKAQSSYQNKRKREFKASVDLSLIVSQHLHSEEAIKAAENYATKEANRRFGRVIIEPVRIFLSRPKGGAFSRLNPATLFIEFQDPASR